MEGLAQDVRHALRTLRRAPGFAAAVTLVLALGIGAVTAVFSLVDAVLLRPLDLPEADRLVRVYAADGEEPYRSLVYSDYVDLREGSASLRGLAAFRETELAVAGSGAAELVPGALVSADYFAVLGVAPLLGRAFTASEAVGGAADPSVAVLGAGLARRRFGEPRRALGETLEVNGHRYTVVGIAPPGFRGVDLSAAPRVWLPMAAYDRVATGFLATFPAVDYAAQRGSRRIGLWRAVGRLRPGTTIEEAGAELRAIARRLERAHPDTNAGLSVTVVPATEAALPLEARGESARFLVLLLGTVGLALLLACASVANLFLARAAGRRGEVGVRLALGAGPGRLARQLLAEGVLLSLAGAVAGLTVAAWTLDLLGRFGLPGDVAIGSLGPSLDARVLGFAVALSLVTAAAASAVPVLAAVRTDLVAAIKRRPEGGRSRRRWARHGLVAVQVALCAVLLVGAGLFLRSLRQALSTDLGIEPRDVATLTVDLGSQGYDELRAAAFFDALLERIEGLPGVRAASVSSVAFGERGLGIGGVYVADRGEAVEPGRVTLERASPAHAEALGLPVVAGRFVARTDGPASEPVAVVGRSLARRLWPRESAVGKRFNFSGPEGTLFTVVGVVEDARERAIQDEPTLRAYLPLSQHADAAAGDPMTVHVRTSGDPVALLGPVREAVRGLDPSVPIYDVGTLEGRVAATLMPQRMGRTVLGLLGGLALALATLGIYGVTASDAGRRRREIGVRVALGALRRDVLRLVLVVGGIPVAVGLAAGLGIAAVAARAATAFLYGVEPLDPLTYAGTALLLGLVGTVACLVPARRAAALDPARVLREE